MTKEIFPLAKLTLVSSWLIVFTAVAVSLPVPILSLATAVIVVLWLIYVFLNPQQIFDTIKNNRIAMLSLALWGLIGLGTLWSQTSWDKALFGWGQYRELLLFPLMASLLAIGWSQKVLYGFLVGSVFATGVSYLQHWGYVPLYKAEMPSAFIHHIPFSTLEAFSIYCFVLLGTFTHNTAVKTLCFALALLLAINLFFINTARSGYMIFAVLSLMLCLYYWRWKGILIYLSSLIIGFILLYSFSHSFQTNILQATQHEVAEAQTNSNLGDFHLRPTLWKNSLTILAENNPIIGSGTGSFPARYHEVTQTNNRNPHQQFILTYAELGVIGLALLVYLLFSQWQTATQMPPLQRYLAYGFLATFIVHSLFNSALMDNTEGHFYALLSVAFWSRKESWL